jgi:hypothetical protein
MGKDANELAMRDPAAAALFGVIGSDFGGDAYARSGGPEQPLYIGPEPMLFTGGDATFSGIDDSSSYDMGFTDIGVDFGADIAFGADAPPTAIVATAASQHGATPQGRAIIAQHMQKQVHRNSRAMLLEPNKYSDLKVERYTFAVNATITALGTAGALSGSNSPDVNFRPQRATTNVVSPGMVTFSDVRVANVSFTVGGIIDAWQWNANAVGQHLDIPTLTPANKATFAGSYTGIVPSPLSGTGTYPFILSFTGPASIVA